MKKFMISVLAVMAFGLPLAAQSEVDLRIQRVEKGLLPELVLKGAPARSIQERMKTFRVPGISIVVIQDFKIAWAKAFGITDVETGEPAKENTLFQAASISKPVAAMAALRKVQEGRLSLDENINNKLTSWKLPDNPLTEKQNVTLKHLLSHSGGTTVHGFRGYAISEAVPTVIQVLNGELPANSAPIRVDIKPGKRYRYSGGGYTIMQQTLIDIEKKTFPQIMQETVLGPLEMTDSTYEQPLPTLRLGQSAAGHRAPGNPVEGKRHTYPEMAAAGLWTTPSDLAKFAIEIQLSLIGKSNKVLSREMTETMLTPFVSNNYGLGLSIDERGFFSHGGSNEGFKCYMIAHKEKGFGAVIMTNGDLGSNLFLEILRSIDKEYNWGAFKPVEVFPLQTEELDTYTGKFSRNEDDVTRFRETEGKLLMSDYREVEIEIFPLGNDKFADIENSEYIQFEKDSEGSITQVAFVRVDGRIRQKRRKIADEYIAPIAHIMSGEYEMALKAYRDIQKQNPNSVSIRENILNQRGYDLLNEMKLDQAVDLFKVTTQLYPHSANTYDSLGDAYSAKGDTEPAIQAYQKCLELIPKDTSGNQENLRRLQINTKEKLSVLEKEKRKHI